MNLMRIKKLWPSSYKSFEVGDVVEVIPSRYLPRCFNIMRPRGFTKCLAVPKEYLEEIREEKL